MFEMVKSLVPNLRPQCIHCDFEQAAIGAMTECFPGVKIRGCFFHLAQSMHRHITAVGATSQYNNDPDFALKAKMILALAFVPHHDLDIYTEALSDFLPEELLPILDWFEYNYIGIYNRRSRRRRPRLFPHDMWSNYETTLNDSDRTNNHAEAAHRRIAFELGANHPTIWKFIETLMKLQKGRDVYMEQLISGCPPPLKLKKYRNADERIKKIVLEYNGERDALEYLRGIAHNYQMN